MDRIFYDNQEYAKYSDKFLKRFNLADHAAYDALPAATKNDDSKVFFIPDKPEHNYLYKWDFTKSLTDSVQGLMATLGGDATFTSGDGVSITGASGYIRLIDGFYPVGKTLEIDVGNMSKQGTGNKRFLMATSDTGFIYRGATNNWEVYTNHTWKSYVTTSQDPNIFNNSTIKVVDENGALKVYKNDTLVFEGADPWSGYLYIGASSNSFYNVTITGVRIYENEEEE